MMASEEQKDLRNTQLQKNLRNIQLQMASEEQRKSDENVLRLVEEQKIEKEEALRKILELERDLNAKQKLELDIEKLKGKLKVMQHMGDDAAVQKQIEDRNTELEDKIDDMRSMEELHHALVTKERETNDELQEARKELISSLSEMLTSARTNIGIKRMREIDARTFEEECKLRFPSDHEYKAIELCSLWQEKLKDSEWYPFKVVRIDDENFKKELNEDDPYLKKLKQEWGTKSIQL